MDEQTDDPRRIVRVYSFQAQDRFPPESDARVLSRVLTDQEPSLEDILQPWRRFYEPWEPPNNERYLYHSVMIKLSTETSKRSNSQGACH